MKTLQQLGTDLGALVEQKNAAYGDSFNVAGEALRLLYPQGIPPEKLDDALLLARIWDKMKRIATDKDAFGETPYQDIAGYGLCGVALHQNKKESSSTWQGSASAQDASNSSKAQPDSAEQLTSAKTTTSASAKSAPEPSQQPASSSAKSEAAPARTVAASAFGSAAARRTRLEHSDLTWKLRQSLGICVACESKEMSKPTHVKFGEWKGDFCSAGCWTFAYELLRNGEVRGVMLP
jgi:hypothetical protein